ncbi:hypothetical protein GCM10027589_14290 [Actinocorallia lasiicapitis]
MGERQPVRLTRRGRVVVVGFAVFVVLGLGAGGRVAFAGGGEGRSGTVVVEPGDTLWSIASSAEPHADPRLVIERIIKLNGLPGVIIEPGQELILP